ncbi:MAG: hypothetical protein C9356_05300 [Oleiphilus sp.]|nr:MAG: hypothetical protein C9356_05300 [Oleiphilus sp.]
MSSSFLEIIELEDGSYALQKIDSDDAPLVVIQFSEQVSEFLHGNEVVVAKAMMGAGVQAASNVSKAVLAKEEEEFNGRTLH